MRYDLKGVRGEGGAVVRTREAVKHGWVTASLPEPPDQIKAALEPPAETPGEEVFGPWPWEAGR